MQDIVRQLVLCALVYNTTGFFSLLPFVSHARGWELSAIGHITNICAFYLITTKKNQKAWPIVCALLIGHLLYKNWFGYYGQTALQNIIMCIVVYLAWRSYNTVNKFNYYAKMLSGVLFLNHLTGYVIHTCYILFCTPQPHSDPLQSVLYQLTGIPDSWLYMTLGVLILFNAYHFHTYPKVAAKDFDPKKSHVLHFLPMHDGARTWLIFLFSMLPIPHYAVYGFHEIRLEWGIWKYSKKENGLVFHPLSSGKLDSLFRRGLILICEPVKIRHRLEPLEGNVPYNIWTGETCHKLAKYIKGELPFDDKWFKIARS